MKQKSNTPLPSKMVGRAWVGVWNDQEHHLGWAVPNFLDNYRVNGPLDQPWAKGTFWKCKITIELLRDRRGRLRSCRREP